MRTLKKTLALVLCLAMIAGLCCFGTSAAFADAADIEYTEAVEVMNALSVLKGDGTNFNPKGILTRAEAAVMMAKMLGGDKLVATSTFKDMAGYEWAQQYAAFCELKGIILGDGKGNFMPGKELTGYEFGLMLCRALGYKPANEGVTADTFEIGTAALMKKIGLSEAIQNFDGTVGLTREKAAALLLKALQTTMVEYLIGGTSITIGGATITTGASAASNVSNTTVDYAGNLGTGAGQNQTMQLCEKYFPTLNKTAVVAADNGGLAGNFWFLNKDKVGAYNAVTDTAIGTYATEAVSVSYVGGTKFVDIVKALGVKNDASKNYTVEVYRNGYNSQCVRSVITGTTFNAGTYTGAALYSNATTFGTIPSGCTVDIVITSTGIIRMLINVEYLGVVSYNGYTKDTNTDDVDDRNVTLAVYVDGAATSPATNITLTALNCAEFEAVYAAAAGLAPAGTLYYVVMPEGDLDGFTGKMLSVVPATSITGKVSANTATTYTIGDKVYYLSATAAGMTVIDSAAAYTTDAVYYLDSTGNILYKTATPGAVPNYVFLEDFATYNKASTGLSELNSVYMQAKLVMLDGTVKVVDVASVQYDADGVAGSTVTYNLTGLNGGTKVDTSNYTTVDTNMDANIYDAYSYTVNEDGTYNLVWANTADAASGSIVAEPVFASGLTAYNTTKFVVRTGAGTTADPYKYAAYTGYAALPVSATVALTAVVTGNSTGNVYYIYGTSSATASQANYVYITSLDKAVTYDAATATYTYTYAAIVNGEPTTVATSADAIVTALDAVGMYSVKYTDGKITAVSDAAGKFTGDAGYDASTVGNLPMTYVSTLAKDGTVAIAGTAKAYNDNTKVYVIDATTSAVKTAAMTDILVGSVGTPNVFVQYVKTAVGADTVTISVLYAVQ